MITAEVIDRMRTHPHPAIRELYRAHGTVMVGWTQGRLLRVVLDALLPYGSEERS